MKRKIIGGILIAFLIISITGCVKYFFRSNYTEANKLIHESKNLTQKPFLKAHLKNGDVCIFKNSWVIDTSNNLLTGNVSRFDYNRSLRYTGKTSIPLDSISIFETNKKIITSETGRMAVLGILTGIDFLIGVYCFTVPKACFGSCPTFYLNDNDNFHYADAEGFSNAISPSLEYTDIDALNNNETVNRSFSVIMKNEALETHCIKELKLLAVPRNKKQRVFQSPEDEFFLCENTYTLTQASNNEKDITQFLIKDDRKEWFSLSDSSNLKCQEEINLLFDKVNNTENPGLIVNFRQTLMTTYFIYKAMGYMGDQVSDIFARLEANNETKDKLEGGIKKELGDIDIYQWDEEKKTWEFVNGLYETGPIAFNRQIIPLRKTSGNKIKLKLVLNKGLWRLDYLALTNIKKKVKPIDLLPEKIYNKGKVDAEALRSMENPEKYLISMPGSEYKFNFMLPEENKDYELFLSSRGYYLEWMRLNWLKDKNLLKLRQLVKNPKKYLKEEAREYKQYERNMENEFWSSKIDTKAFSYHEK